MFYPQVSPGPIFRFWLIFQLVLASFFKPYFTYIILYYLFVHFYQIIFFSFSSYTFSKQILTNIFYSFCTSYYFFFSHDIFTNNLLTLKFIIYYLLSLSKSKKLCILRNVCEIVWCVLFK